MFFLSSRLKHNNIEKTKNLEAFKRSNRKAPKSLTSKVYKGKIEKLSNRVKLSFILYSLRKTFRKIKSYNKVTRQISNYKSL